MTGKEAANLLRSIVVTPDIHPDKQKDFDTAFLMALEALKEREWNVVEKRPMDEEEREEWKEELGYEVADEDAFIYFNLPEEGEEVLITTAWGSVTTATIEYDGRFYNFENYDFEDVVAWKLKPKPYKEVED